jgi:crotonobetaine/carnitine-CoA ligase
MSTFREMISRSAEKWGDRTFIRYNDEEISFRAFDQMADRVAHLLFQHGIRKGDKVLLFLPNCLEFFYAWCGASKIGAVVVPTNFSLKADELKYNVNHSGSRAVISKPPFADVVQEIRKECPEVTHCFLAGEEDSPGEEDRQGFVPFRFDLSADPPAPPDIPLSPDDLLVILYTSGTTGRPKGVMHTHGTYLCTIETWVKEWLRQGDVTMSILPMFHVSGHIYTVFPHLIAGCSVVIQEQFSASKFWDLAREYRLNYMTMPMTVLLILLAQPATDQDKDHSIRRFVSSCSPQMAEAFEQRFGVEVCPSYGLSEDPLMLLAYPVTEDVRHKRAYPPHGGALLGKPLFPEKHRVKILDNKGREPAPGNPGRILFTGPSCMLGYYHNPEETQKAMKDGWVDSGDYGYMDEEGFVYFLDRTKDIVRRKGENISSREIENVLNSHAAVEVSAVIPVPDPIRVEEVKAYIILKQGQGGNPAELADFCMEKLADFKVPRYWEFRDELPRTPDFKIQKVILKNEKPDLTKGCYDREKGEFNG